jgi:3-hydroxybutyryl-CoA dehydrogenase
MRTRFCGVCDGGRAGHRAPEIEISLTRKDRFAALHFNVINTVVEIMRGAETSDDTIDVLEQFTRSLGEIPLVMKKEIAGYVVNSMIVPWLEAGPWLAAGGYASIEDVDRTWMLITGTQAGPFGQLDYIGLDVAFDIGEIMEARGVPCHWSEIREYLQPHLDKGHLGIKTLQGIYSYPDPAYARPGFLKPDHV